MNRMEFVKYTSFHLWLFFLFIFIFCFSLNWNRNWIRRHKLRIDWALNAILKQIVRGHGTQRCRTHFTLSLVVIYRNRIWPEWCRDRQPMQRMTQMVIYLINSFIIKIFILISLHLSHPCVCACDYLYSKNYWLSFNSVAQHMQQLH